MAEECPTSEVPKIKEDDTPMECEMSESQSVKADDSSQDKGALMLPVSEATSAAASPPVSDSECAMNPEDTHVKEGALALPISGATSAAVSTSVSEVECAISPEDINVKAGALTLSVSGATSAAASTSVSDSECAMSPEDVNVKGGALTLPVSTAMSAATSTSISDSGCAMSPEEGPVKEALMLPVSGATSAAVSYSECATSPDDTHAKVDAELSGLPEPTAMDQVSGSTAGNQEILSAGKVAEMLSPEKEKVGLFKGVKTAIKSKVKSVWKKLSPKKAEKAALAASQETESSEAPAPDKKPIKVVTYVSATRGSLVLNSVASEEMTLDTDLPTTSASEVFLPDEDSIATCDTSTHASRLPSLGESSSEPSPEHKAQQSSGDRGDEAMDDGNVDESS